MEQEPRLPGLSDHQALPPWDDLPLQNLVKGMATVACVVLLAAAVHGLIYDAPLPTIISLLTFFPVLILALPSCPLPSSQRSLLLSITLITAIGATLVIGRDGSQSVGILALPAVLLIAATTSSFRGYVLLATTTLTMISLISTFEILGFKDTALPPDEIRRRLLITLPLLAGCAVVVRLVAGTLVKTLHRMHVDTLTDLQTSLPNRRALEIVADQQRPATDSRGMRTVLAISIQRLDSLKSLFGYPFGDAVLRHAAEIISAHASPDCFVGRWSNNVFLLLIRHRAASDLPTLCARDIQQSLRAAHLIEGVEVHLDAHCGISFDFEGTLDPSEQIEQALITLDEARQGGADALAEYSDNLSQRIAAEYRYETAIRQAIDKDRVKMAYQPIFTVDGRQVVAVEALMRLCDDEGQLIPAGEAISLAETSGLIHRLGRTILRAILDDIRNWGEYGTPRLPVLVNFSAHQLAEPDMVETLTNNLTAHQLGPGALIVEFTETAAAASDVSLTESLRSLHQAGIPLAIDDFGAGYSSLLRLLELPAALIKFDSALIHRAGQSEMAREFLHHASHLAHSTGASVLIEGVETEAQAIIAEDLGCFAVQGYWYAKPMASEEIPAYLATQQLAPFRIKTPASLAA